MFTCKICNRKFTELAGLYSHLETKHAEMIPEKMTTPQYYYYMKTGRLNGNCVVCKQPTKWNEKTGKYNRFCEDPKCKEVYSAEFKKRMVAKYGKVHLLNDPNKQREMLANRKISGRYKWDNGSETTYTGSYELDFLKMVDNFLDWDPEDIMMPSPHNYVYKYQGEDKIYIPDAFIPSLDLEIEIKDGGDNPNMHYKIQDVDKVKEQNKDDVMTTQKSFHYIKITNKNYSNLFSFLAEYKSLFEKHGDEKKVPRIFKIEDIKTRSSVLTESSVVDVVVDAIKAVEKTKITDISKMVEYNITTRFNNSEDLKRYMSGLVDLCKDFDDVNFLRRQIKRIDDTFEKSDKEVVRWLRVDLQDQLNKKSNKILEKGVKEACEYDDILFEFMYVDNIFDSALLYENKLTEVPSNIKSKLLAIINLPDSDIDSKKTKNLKEVVKDNLTVSKLQTVIVTLIRAAKTIKAIKFIKDVIILLPVGCKLFKDRHLSGDEYIKSLDDILKKFGVDDSLMESTISYSRLNEFLQDDTDERIKKYIQTYNDYYMYMHENQPDSTPNINTDIIKAKKYISDLSKTGKVNKKLARYAISELDHLGMDYVRTESVEISQPEEVSSFTIQLVYDPKRCPFQAFMLRDTNSRIYVNETFYLQRINDPRKCAWCKSGFEDIYVSENEKLLEFLVILPEPINLREKLEILNGSDIKLNSLFKPEDSQNLFMKEICRLIGVEGSITRTSSFLY